MDPCVPRNNAGADARSYARVKLGVPPKYAKKMSAKQVCAAAKACKSTNIMPPMDYRVYKGKGYLIDPETPLSIQDYIAVFKQGDLTKIKKIAGNLGLVPASLSKRELITNIVEVLKSFNLAEPIELPYKRSRGAGNSNASMGLGNASMGPGLAPGEGEGEGEVPGEGEGEVPGEGEGEVPGPGEGEGPGPGNAGAGALGNAGAGQFKQMNAGNSGQQTNTKKLYGTNSVGTSVGSFHDPNPGRITNNSTPLSNSNSNFKSKSSWKWPWQSRNNSSEMSSSSSQNVSEQLKSLQKQANNASKMLSSVKRDVVGSNNDRSRTVSSAVQASIGSRNNPLFVNE